MFSMLFLKTFKDAKFVVDGNAFQTFITLSMKSFCLMLAVHLGLNSLYLWHVCTYVCRAEAFPATCSVLDVEPVQKTCAVIRVYDDVQCYAHFPQLMTVYTCWGEHRMHNDDLWFAVVLIIRGFVSFCSFDFCCLHFPLLLLRYWHFCIFHKLWQKALPCFK